MRTKTKEFCADLCGGGGVLARRPEVSQSYHYPLPRGLEPGTLVKLLSHDHGYWTVEAHGKQFVVFGPQVDAGFLYELNGRWLPADDPRVIARKKATSFAASPAYSCVAGGCVNPPV